MWISTLELINFLLVYDHQDSSEHGRFVIVDEKSLCQVLLINKITQILVGIRWTVLLLKITKHNLQFILFVKHLLEPNIANLLDACNFGTDGAKLFVHLKLHGVPLETMNVLMNFLGLLLSTSTLALDFHVQLEFLV